MTKIKVEVNGKEVELQKNSTVQDFVQQRNVEGTMFVVEKNLKVIPKDEYNTEKLSNGDKIELVGFFGGG